MLALLLLERLEHRVRAQWLRSIELNTAEQGQLFADFRRRGAWESPGLRKALSRIEIGPSEIVHNLALADSGM